MIIKELFEKTCHWLESEADSELYTIADIFMKMPEFNGSEEIICSEKTIKRKLQDRYGDHLSFAELPGKLNVICFRNMASYIIDQMRKKALKALKIL